MQNWELIFCCSVVFLSATGWDSHHVQQNRASQGKKHGYWWVPRCTCIGIPICGSRCSVWSSCCSIWSSCCSIWSSCCSIWSSCCCIWSSCCSIWNSHCSICGSCCPVCGPVVRLHVDIIPSPQSPMGRGVHQIGIFSWLLVYRYHFWLQSCPDRRAALCRLHTHPHSLLCSSPSTASLVPTHTSGLGMRLAHFVLAP